MARSERITLADLVNKYNTLLPNLPSGTQLELEIKPNYAANRQPEEWRALWTAAYQRLYSRSLEEDGWQVACGVTLRIINNQPVPEQLEAVYVAGQIQGDGTGFRKTPIHRTIQQELKYALSREQSIPTAELKTLLGTHFNTRQIELSRFRLRTSFQTPDLPGWRVDITYVVSLKGRAPDAKDQALLPRVPVTPDNFLQHAQGGRGELSWEIELEYVGGGTLTSEQVQEAGNLFYQWIWPHQRSTREYEQVVRALAKRFGRRMMGQGSLKQLVNNPVTLDLRTYRDTVYPHLGDYYLTEKADGQRAWLIVSTPADLGIREDGIREETPTTARRIFLIAQEVYDITEHLPKAKLTQDQILDIEWVPASAMRKGVGKAAAKAKAPAVKAPAVKAPAVKAPAVKAPAVKAPAVKAPAVKAPVKPVTKAPAKKGRNDIPDDTPNDTPNDKPDDILDDTSNDKPNDIPNDTSTYLPDDILDGTSTYQPSRSTEILDDITHGMTHDGMKDAVLHLTSASSPTGGAGKLAGPLYLYAFDALVVDGVPVADASYDVRLSELQRVAPELGIRSKIQIPLDPANPAVIANHWAQQHPYVVDGTIFTPRKPGYWEAKVYKWKPDDQMTVDFLVMRAPKDLIGNAYLALPEHTVFLLYCGASRDKVVSGSITLLPVHHQLFRGYAGNGEKIPVQFTTPRYPLAYVYQHPNSCTVVGPDALHGHVAEFLPLLDKKSPSGIDGTLDWRLQRMRPDKDENVRQGVDFGNAYTTAYTNFQALLQPLSISEMSSPATTAPATDYFATEKGAVYKHLTYYCNFVKANLLQILDGANKVLELGVGKGQDLTKYSGWGVKTLVGVDQDITALDELERRVLDLGQPQWYVYPPKPAKVQLKIHTVAFDLSKPGLDKVLLSKKLSIGQDFEGIVSNLSIHYWMPTVADIARLTRMLGSSLRSGGHFICSMFHGHLIWRLLRRVKQGETWDLGIVGGNAGKPRYSIRKLYAKDASFEHGLPIEVLLPFSDGKYYTEHLMDHWTIEQKLTEAGYTMVGRGTFQDMYSRYLEWSRYFKHKHQLDEVDRTYSGLYAYLVFRRQ
jgi:hypothetical protein